MFYSISWFVIALLIAAWSMVAWALNGVVVWAVSNAGALSGKAAGVDGLALPDWLSPWIAPELAQTLSALAAWMGPIAADLLQSAPALAGVLTVASWLVWGVGTAVLLLVGVGLHLLIGLWRRRAGGTGAPPLAGPTAFAPSSGRTARTAAVQPATANARDA